MTSGIEGAEAAELVVDLGGVAVWDVSALLPRHATKRYPLRDPASISHVFVHHSGAEGMAGFEGLLRSTRYCVRQKPAGAVPGFPGCPYHLWIPRARCVDGRGRLVVFRAQPEAVRSWHTGGVCNGFGLGVALQGNTTRNGLSAQHEECLEAVLPWLLERLARGDAAPDSRMLEVAVPTLSWHSEASRWGGHDKPACPGKAAVEWLTAYRASSDWAGAPEVS